LDDDDDSAEEDEDNDAVQTLDNVQRLAEAEAATANGSNPVKKRKGKMYALRPRTDIQWERVICDDGHRVKTIRTRLHQSVRLLRRTSI
jgi:hypothetical protein